MHRKYLLSLVVLLSSIITSAQYEQYFTTATMRLDYNHVGTASEEHFAFDQMVNDGQWAGSKTVLIDEFRLGKYFFEVKEPETQKVLYSRGYSSIYGEWETTPDAKDNWGSFHESVRFPWPKAEVDVTIYKRNRLNGFDPVWTYRVNPKHHRAFTAPVEQHYNTFDVVVNGTPEKQVDIVVLGEGYAKEDMDKFHKDNKTIRNASAAVPYEFTAILMNDSIYGGGGIYNLYITAAVNNAFQEYLFVHEFGHHFADLADEYYTSATAYEMDAEHLEPWELNVTANPDPETIKWKDIVTPGTPIPTPWEKEKYDKHSIDVQKKRVEMRKAKVDEKVMEDFFLDKKAWDDKLLANMKYSGQVGAFEGAQHKATGMYRSAANCIMFTRHDHFCPACQRGIKLIIDQYTK
ncbi:hypothetical protein KEM09_19360 [Carboxylicivirga mesophila]|uniref:Peptidase M64 N-terminal domain-containing protein n=1 Tax=Carboxylicivirga mesophila TaxID=1166478 RepID=A0ABS5KEZ3_9BACT|nr:M64 family metallopeptidase [Carboxylicivirga mesophila]MBS2213575.1 hypothetical protein [Carboxylicivirga mesophila]